MALMAFRLSLVVCRGHDAKRTKVDHPMNVTENALLPTRVAKRQAQQKWTVQLSLVSSNSRWFCPSTANAFRPDALAPDYAVEGRPMLIDW